MVKPFDKWSEVIIALGSNLNDKTVEINKALTAINAIDGIKLLKCSSFMPYAAVGFKSDNEFLNAVCICQSNLHPEIILKHLLSIENNQNRKRQNGIYIDRSIDLDVLTYGDVIYKSKDLELPHPRLHLRQFVLEPLIEILPNWMHPKIQKNATELLVELKHI